MNVHSINQTVSMPMLSINNSNIKKASLSDNPCPDCNGAECAAAYNKAAINFRGGEAHSVNNATKELLGWMESNKIISKAYDACQKAIDSLRTQNPKNNIPREVLQELAATHLQIDHFDFLPTEVTTLKEEISLMNANYDEIGKGVVHINPYTGDVIKTDVSFKE